MTSRVALVAGALAIAQTAAWAQQAPGPDDPMVHFGLFASSADGRRVGSATTTNWEVGAHDPGILYLSPCSTMGTNSESRPLPAAATDVWNVSTRILSLDQERVSVQITWQPVRREGQDRNEPPQSTTLTLGRGERSRVEHVHIPARGECEARSAALEVVFASRNELYARIPAAAGTRGGGGGVSNTPTGATGSSGAGGGRVVSEGSAGGVTNVAVRQQGAAAPSILHADLWLVRSAPGQPDTTMHLTSSVSSIPVTFAFAPITIEAASGTATVQVEGTVEVGYTPEGERRFFFSASRRLGFSPANRPARDGAPSNEASSKTSVPVPSEDQILSFELPPLQLPGGGGVLPDRFSIRVRLTPRDMQPMPRTR
jgi:hypothetical protein